MRPETHPHRHRPAAETGGELVQPSTATARAIVRALCSAGVTDVVICPGSRSAPLTYALAQAAAAGRLQVRVRIDERSAAFYALGLAKGHRVAGHRRPVAVLTTSGSAVANLHPAFLEAAYAHLPLIALTADRPARLRGTGANQTIDAQAHVLGEVIARCDVPAGSTDAEAMAAACLAHQRVGPGGPVQLNVQFDTPLVPTAAEAADPWAESLPHPETPGPAVGGADPAPGGPDPAIDAAVTAVDNAAAHTIVLAGDTHGFPVTGLGEAFTAAGVPILAEPSTPLIDADTAISAHPAVLTDHPELRAGVRTIIVIGKPTLFRPDAALLTEPGRHIIRIPAGAEAALASQLTTRIAARPTARLTARCATPRSTRLASQRSASGLPDWAQRWVEAGRACQTSACDLRSALVQAAITASGSVRPHVYAASSSAIRIMSEVIAAVPVDKRARIHASRGLAGIDGLISTAVGFSQVCAGGAQSAPVRLVIGDLAMLHDIGGLLREAGEALPALQIVVLNDDGGQIFAGLEHGQEHLVPYFQRFFATPHGRGLADFAAGYGWPYARIESAEQLSELLAAGQAGVFEALLPAVASPALSRAPGSAER